MKLILTLIYASLITAASAAPETIWLILAMGQSNMVGNSEARTPPEPTTIFDTSILYYASAGTDSGSGNISDGINSSSWGDATDLYWNTGPERSAARVLAKAGHKVAVVKWARNGESIGEWLSGGDFYDYWRPYFTDRVAELESMGYTVKIAFLWQHGHANMESSEGSYSAAFTTLLADVRDLSGGQPVPFAIARQHIDTVSTQSISVIRGEQESVADNDPLGEWYNLDDLTLRDGTTHLDNIGYQQAGIRAGTELVELIDSL